MVLEISVDSTRHRHAAVAAIAVAVGDVTGQRDRDRLPVGVVGVITLRHARPETGQPATGFVESQEMLDGSVSGDA